MTTGQWHYAGQGGPVGPVSWEQLGQMAASGQLTGEQLVWSPGMDQWVQAATIGGLFAAGGVMPMAYARPTMGASEKISRNAKQNSIVMFVLFVLALSMAAIGFVLAATPTRGGHGAGIKIGMIFGNFFAVAGALFAAIYVPVRWTYLKQLPPPYKTLGMIGGFGLIAILVLGVLSLIVGIVAGLV